MSVLYLLHADAADSEGQAPIYLPPWVLQHHKKRKKWTHAWRIESCTSQHAYSGWCVSYRDNSGL